MATKKVTTTKVTGTAALAAFIALSILALLLALPTALLLMLFLGNLDVNVSFWGAIPGGLLLAGLTGSKKGS